MRCSCRVAPGSLATITRLRYCIQDQQQAAVLSGTAECALVRLPSKMPTE
jgi:hypothetical protein